MIPTQVVRNCGWFLFWKN